MFDGNIFLSLAYHFSLCLYSLFGFSLLRWSPNTWCEQIWKLLVVIQVMEMQLCKLGSIFVLVWSTICVLLFCNSLQSWAICCRNCFF